MESTIQIMKALSDPTRLRLVRVLATGEEFCVCVLMEALEMPQYHVSKHLGVLRRAGLVKHRRRGTWAHYSLSPDLCEAHRNLVAGACGAIAEDPIVHGDLERLRRARPEVGEAECCEDDCCTG